MKQEAVKSDDLLEAFEFVNAGQPSENEGYLCIETGVVHYHSELGDLDEELPEDMGIPENRASASVTEFSEQQHQRPSWSGRPRAHIHNRRRTHVPCGSRLDWRVSVRSCAAGV